MTERRADARIRSGQNEGKLHIPPRGFIWKLMLYVLLLGLPKAAQAGPPWEGIIDRSRATDWSAAGVEGGIPSGSWTQCGATVAAYTGTGSTIQTAIDNCPANHYVLLGPGTFNLSSGFSVSKNGVAVRGSGANQTFLNISGDSVGASCGYFYTAAIKLCASSSVPQNSANWTAGYAQGTTQITLSNTAGIVNGTVLLLDQLDDGSDGWPTTGDLYICSTTGNCSSQGGGYGFGRSGRASVQLVKATNVAGSVVTISPPITLPNYRSSQDPGAVWAASASNILVGAGVEDLSLDFDGGQVGIELANTLNCWVKGVRSVYTGAAGSFINHYEVINGLHDTVRDNYIYGPTTVAITSYPYSPNNASSMLFENNIFHGPAGAMVTDGPYSNSVFSYNFFPGHLGPGVVMHGAGEMMDLYEGNVTTGWYGDVVHGTRAFQTVFRNAMIGHRYGGSGATVNNAMQAQAHNRFINVIGNVMGDSYFTTYQVTLTANQSSAIYSLGWQGNASGSGTPQADPDVLRTLMRWGNWDSVTNATRWCGNSSDTGWSTTCASTSEVPCTITNFSNPVPFTETLPASFYLASKPNWWPAAKPWPVIGPDVTGGNITNMAGHAYTNPAADCYLTVMGGPADGSGNPLSFNASPCYGSSSGNTTPPSSPTNLRIR